MSYELQKQIKENAEDVRSYIKDLYTWEDDVEKKEKTKKQKQKQDDTEQKPIRNQGTSKPSEENQEKQEEAKKYKRDVNTVQDYYNNWNKFDVDGEIDKLEQDEKITQVNPYENFQTTSKTAPRTKIQIKGGRTFQFDINSMKDKGNLYYQSNDFNKALECYSECIKNFNQQSEDQQEQNKEMKVIIYSNRAMNYIKLQEYQKAVADCDVALQCDNKHAKSYSRRAISKKKLSRFKEALEDFQKSYDIDKSNQIKNEIDVLQAKLDSKKEEALKKMVLTEKIPDSQLTNAVTVLIEDKDTLEEDYGELEIKEENKDEKEERKSSFVSLKAIDRMGSKTGDKGTKSLDHINDIDEDNSKNKKENSAVKIGTFSYFDQKHKDKNLARPSFSILKNRQDLQPAEFKNLKDIETKQDGEGELKTDEMGEDLGNIHFAGNQVVDDKKTYKHEYDHSEKPRHSILVRRDDKDSAISIKSKNSKFSGYKDVEILKKHQESDDNDKSSLEDEDDKVKFTKDLVVVDIDDKSPISKPNYNMKPRRSILKNLQQDNFKRRYSFQDLTEKQSNPQQKLFRRNTEKISGQIDEEDLSKSNSRETLSKSVQMNEVLSQSQKELNKEVLSNSSNFSNINSSTFLSQWGNLKNEYKSAIQYLENIEAKNLTNIFKQGFEMNTIIEIFTVLIQFADTKTELVKDYIQNISQTKRFDLQISMMIKSEKKVFIELFDKLKNTNKITEEFYNSQKKVYHL